MQGSSATHVKSKPPGISRQSSRQVLLLRSHQLPLGRWHLKSVLITAGFILVFTYYAYRMDLHTGLKRKRQDLVVRPAKPYKSPTLRRRHSKPQKDGKTSLPVKMKVNDSLAHFVKKSDTKISKTNSVSFQQKQLNEIGLTPSKIVEKHSNISSSKNRQNLTSSFQINSKNNHIIDILKANRKPDNKQFSTKIIADSFKGILGVKFPGQTGTKNNIPGNGFVQQWSENTELSKFSPVPSPVHRDAKYVKPVFEIKAHDNIKHNNSKVTFKAMNVSAVPSNVINNLDSLVVTKSKFGVSGDSKHITEGRGVIKNSIGTPMDVTNNFETHGYVKNKVATVKPVIRRRRNVM